MSLAFLLTAFVVVLVPGTGVLYTIAVGLGRGRRARDRVLPSPRALAWVRRGIAATFGALAARLAMERA